MSIIVLFGIISIIEGVVLDPALYLSPSPPLTTTHDNKAEKFWLHNSAKDEENVILPIETGKTSTETLETLNEAETFWPSYRPSRLRGIHIPLSFHVSGMYGGNSGTGVLTSGYMGIDDSRGKGVLAGNGYKSFGSRPGVRVYGSDAKPAWGGWGNGKWGHYGKG